MSIYNNNINLCSLQEPYKPMDKKSWEQKNGKIYTATKHRPKRGGREGETIHMEGKSY